MILPSPEVKVQADDAKRTLRILNYKAANLRTPLTQIKNLMVAEQAENFASGGSLYGGWAGPSPETAIGTKLLVRTGKMAKEFGKKTGPGKKVDSRRGIVRAGIHVEDERGKPYARFHQSGAPAGNRKGALPKREVVGITDETEAKAVEILRRYLASTK